MKFGYDSEGRLVPIEQIRLAEAIADLDSKLNGQPAEARPAVVDRLRKLLQEAGELISADDESVFSLYTDGLLEFTNVQEYFGVRLQHAVHRRHGGGDSEA